MDTWQPGCECDRCHRARTAELEERVARLVEDVAWLRGLLLAMTHIGN